MFFYARAFFVIFCVFFSLYDMLYQEDKKPDTVVDVNSSLLSFGNFTRGGGSANMLSVDQPAYVAIAIIILVVGIIGTHVA